jgi:hypothetical protein
VAVAAGAGFGAFEGEAVGFVGHVGGDDVQVPLAGADQFGGGEVGAERCHLLGGQVADLGT